MRGGTGRAAGMTQEEWKQAARMHLAPGPPGDRRIGAERIDDEERSWQSLDACRLNFRCRVFGAGSLRRACRRSREETPHTAPQSEPRAISIFSRWKTSSPRSVGKEEYTAESLHPLWRSLALDDLRRV